MTKNDNNYFGVFSYDVPMIMFLLPYRALIDQPQRLGAVILIGRDQQTSCRNLIMQ